MWSKREEHATIGMPGKLCCIPGVMTCGMQGWGEACISNGALSSRAIHIPSGAG